MCHVEMDEIDVLARIGVTCPELVYFSFIFVLFKFNILLYIFVENFKVIISHMEKYNIISICYKIIKSVFYNDNY